MTHKSALLVLFIAFSTSVFGQTEPAVKTKRPDIPGTFLLELGVNRMLDKPNALKYGLWGSRTLNVYYQHDMRILKSKFSFHPAVGLAMERFKLMSFKQYSEVDTISFVNPTLTLDADGNTRFLNDYHYIYDADTLGAINYAGTFKSKKSMMTMTYVDVPLELRFSVKPEDPAHSFKVGIGGRIGYLLGAHTKIKYRENGDIKKLKTADAFNLSPFRYSASLKVYIGNFAFFGYYNISPLWKEGKGPSQTKAQSFTVGISLNSF